MGGVVNLSLRPSSIPLPNNPISSPPPYTNNTCSFQNFGALSQHLRSNPRFTCLFSNNRKQEQARKALEGALSGNKDKFEKWNQEIKKREELGGGGNAGGGGWFGWGGRFGWSGGDNFWQEAQQTGLAVLGIIVLFFIAAKGDLLLAVILNPLLIGLRSTRNAFAYIMSLLTGKSYSASEAKLSTEPVYISAKDSVVKKWGSD